MTMKLINILLCLLFVSCTTAYNSKTEISQGKVKKEKNLLVKMGGKAEFDSTEGKGMYVKTDDEASFKHGINGVVSYGASALAAGSYDAYNAGKQATAQLGIRSGAATDQLLIKTTGQAATVLGSNPEANVGAIKETGNLFKNFLK